MTDPDLDHFTAEQLASGTADLAADHAYAPVADLFAFLRQDALPEELLAEVPVVARLVEVIDEAALGAEEPRRQPMLRKFLSARFAAATIIGVASLGGVAAASGSLPSSVQRAVADAVAPVISVPGNGAAGTDAGDPDATTPTTGVTAPAGTTNTTSTANATTATTAETDDAHTGSPAWTGTPASAPCPDPDRPGFAKTHPDTSTTDTDATTSPTTPTTPTSTPTTGPQGRACGQENSDDRGTTSTTTATTAVTNTDGNGGGNGNGQGDGHGDGHGGPPAAISSRGARASTGSRPRGRSSISR